MIKYEYNLNCFLFKNCICYCDGKAKFSASLLQALVPHRIIQKLQHADLLLMKQFFIISVKTVVILAF